MEKPCDEPVCLTERAQYFASIGDNDKARAHFLEALKKCDVNTHKEIVFKVRHNYAQFLSGIQDHASAGEYYELAADILRSNPAEQAKFALESYLGGLNYSIAAKYEASNRMLNQALSVYAQMLPDRLDKYVDASIALCRNYGFTKEYGKALEILTKAENCFRRVISQIRWGKFCVPEAVSYTDRNNMQKQQQTTNRLQTFTKFFPAVM